MLTLTCQPISFVFIMRNKNVFLPQVAFEFFFSVFPTNCKVCNYLLWRFYKSKLCQILIIFASLMRLQSSSLHLHVNLTDFGFKPSLLHRRQECLSLEHPYSCEPFTIIFLPSREKNAYTIVIIQLVCTFYYHNEFNYVPCQCEVLFSDLSNKSM